MMTPQMMNLRLTLALLLVSCSSFAQNPVIQRIHPTNWWVGMKNPNLQLLVYGPNIAKTTVSTTYPGVQIKKTHKVENPNYLFIDLLINKTAKAGTMSLFFSDGSQKTVQNYVLGTKKHVPAQMSPADLIYLIMPDRFSDGDPTNNKFADMADPNSDRKNPWLRHGGDLLGIQNHLDYFSELGVTALWLNPVTENNQPLTNENNTIRSAYHGYGFTDHYAIDRRLGGNNAYKKLVQAAHAKGLKIVQDAVYNHVGINHWFLKDAPSKDWLNQWPSYTNTSHKDQPLTDPYASQSDLKVFTDGWFVPFLPDLNQRNPFVANYLTQHALWTVEEFGIDAWRIDTYKYNDLAYMNRCNETLMSEYPTLFLFGETTANTPLALAYYTQNNLQIPFKCNLESSCDFPLSGALLAAVNQNFGWDEGVSRLYQTLAQDFVYKNPSKLVTFLDNHDSDRFLSVVGEDFDKYKMGLTLLLTTRGIPQVYYGTEILMKNTRNPTDAEVRRDFPGGFPGDSINKFVAKGRTAKENEAFDFVKKLANYRKNTQALHSGKLTQYQTNDGLYVFFRYDANKTIMVVTNTTATAQTFGKERFAERMTGFSKAKNILIDQTISDLSKINIPAKTAWVLELSK
jgi:neopullulanase